jgi:transposase
LAKVFENVKFFKLFIYSGSVSNGVYKNVYFVINSSDMNKLTITQKSDLEQKIKKAHDIYERNRICVILGYDEGISKDLLAKSLRISPRTVEVYLREYFTQNKTENDPRGGSEPKLTEEQRQSLLKHLNENTYLKVQAIVAYIKEQFGVLYTRTGMRDWLVREGFVYKRPEKVPGKLDPEKQQIFIEEYKLLKKTLKSDEEIYFVDASHPEYQSQNVCGWIKKGEKKTLQTTGKQQRLHIVGALKLDGLKILTEEYKTVDTSAMMDFFTKLENQSKASVIHVILDNGRAHKNKQIEAALLNSKIKLHYLPSYSPNLNPIERLWKLMREKVHYNRYYKSAAEFFLEVREFFQKGIPKMKEILQARLNDRFQVIRLNPIQLAV